MTACDPNHAVCSAVAQAIVAGIESVDVVPGRCEIIDEGQPFPVIVDSASTAESFTRLLVRQISSIEPPNTCGMQAGSVQP